MAKKPKLNKQVEALTHEEASRKNIPTAEYQSLIEKENQTPLYIAYERRNRDLDPQLVLHRHSCYRRLRTWRARTPVARPLPRPK